MLYNFSNISSGGGVQVSLSLIEYFLNDKILRDNHYLFSKKLFDILENSNINLDNINYKISNSFFSKIIYLTFNNHKVIYTVFGPTYAIKFSDKKWINGFAQPWILFPNNDVYQDLSFFSQIQFKIKFFIQKKFYQMSNILIVEHNFVKQQLESIIKNKKIIVAENSINQCFIKPGSWKEIHLKKSSKKKIGIIGSGYIHKNLKIIPKVKKLLFDLHKIDAEFYVTLPNTDYCLLGNNFTENVINLDVLQIEECPSFYSKMDLIFLPTKLECFSATILESVFMKKPIVCADYVFNNYIDSGLIYHYNKNNYVDASNQIEKALNRNNNDNEQKLQYIIKRFNSSNRFKIIKQTLLKHLNSKQKLKS